MPINYKDYPKNWKWLSKQIIQREGNKCYFCQSENGKLQLVTKSKVVLTVHHIDGNTFNNRLLNLIALCQRCHLRLDIDRKLIKRKGVIMEVEVECFNCGKEIKQCCYCEKCWEALINEINELRDEIDKLRVEENKKNETKIKL